MKSTKFPTGTVHDLSEDLKKAIQSIVEAEAAWEDITPIARNEFICWVDSAKKHDTRMKRIERTKIDLITGKRRPCCWAGCPHREKIV